MILLLSSCISGPTKNKQKIEKGLLFGAGSDLTWPTKGKIISPFGPRNGKMHSGIDIKGPTRSAIYAVDRGKVIFAGHMSGYGLSLIIKHRNHYSLYGHCSKIKVKENSYVRKGQTIAVTGSSGNASTEHLHFEYLDSRKQALNPTDYLGGRPF